MTDRINRILQNEQYRMHLLRIEEHEADRLFCRHNMGHFLDVARIAMILNAKEQYEIEDEMIYAVALLHDIGRWQQYETGEDHAHVSALLAPEILTACGFSEKEQEQIVSAIATHRDKNVTLQHDLNGLLYRADKLSRPCFACKQQKACNWKGEKKNLLLGY